jgi:hypothetical protein
MTGESKEAEIIIFLELLLFDADVVMGAKSLWGFRLL